MPLVPRRRRGEAPGEQMSACDAMVILDAGRRTGHSCFIIALESRLVAVPGSCGPARSRHSGDAVARRRPPARLTPSRRCLARDHAARRAHSRTEPPMAVVDFAELTAPVSPTEPCGPDLDLAGDTKYMNFVARVGLVIPEQYFR